MYGNGDSSNHVVPDLIKKCKLAKENDTDFVIKGSGNAKRQFLFVDDFSRILKKVVCNLKQFDKPVVAFN
jgi:nucleoside-diphosphate-sugar epimerase